MKDPKLIEVPGAANGSFTTPNFTGVVEVSTAANDGSITVKATRANGGGADGYVLGIKMAKDGGITRGCNKKTSSIDVCSAMPDWNDTTLSSAL